MIKVKQKAMEYGKETIGKELLYLEEKENGFKIAVLNIRGSHPCGYIGVPKSYLNNLGLDDKEIVSATEDDFDADVHYGFTYCGSKIWTDESDLLMEDGGLWLGWDYAHCNDYCALPKSSKYFESPRFDEKTYTTEEIISEANMAIETLEWYGSEE